MDLLIVCSPSLSPSGTLSLLVVLKTAEKSRLSRGTPRVKVCVVTFADFAETAKSPPKIFDFTPYKSNFEYPWEREMGKRG